MIVSIETHKITLASTIIRSTLKERPLEIISNSLLFNGAKVAASRATFERCRLKVDVSNKII